MELGRVKGQVVATIRDPRVPHASLLLVDLINAEGDIIRYGQVTVDTLGAGEGEYVLLVRGGGAAPRTATGERSPVDLNVIAIVDQITASGGKLYAK
ncbi:EutN/CcmL family microcompartment protein [Desulfotalea psychrophila]|uniref:Related to ethanolamine utilization protein (EutN) n=1 Tax=Desulfotalea psychrophila (strain LSv54 / DSM 12343) TaxID=177439 RepID=Q6AIS2_DESPS|nr:EutN/CcmL family microcompartment protein [Desulfotalea psychrophila]CAG37758.1 related to ethanolamine utilization protein (EutN) [Desulfotalea psychrophila LSv54]